MEESLRGEVWHVHTHLYMHLQKAYRKQGAGALSEFAFEGIHPHVVPNTASGKSYSGAIKFGHFYVVANKIGTVSSRSNFEPWVEYAVEGWWLDNLLKAGKLSHEVYLDMAARVVYLFCPMRTYFALWCLCG